MPANVDVPVPEAKNWSASMSPPESMFEVNVDVAPVPPPTRRVEDAFKRPVMLRMFANVEEAEDMRPEEKMFKESHVAASSSFTSVLSATREFSSENVSISASLNKALSM